MRVKGFTLIEIMVVLVIVGILAVVALPNYNTYIQQKAAQNAYSNLLAIYHAQRNYYFNRGAFYQSSSLANINSNLSLNLIDSYFTYSCTSNLGYVCTASSISVTGFNLSVNNGPLVAGTNPSCISPSGTSYCPS